MKCPGCCTSFKEGDRLVLQGLHIEYKNYNFPIRDQKPIRTLLKTIVSFINSQGGTIYIGVQDNKGQVRGVSLDEDARLQFVQFVKDLSKKIQPDVNKSPDPLIKLQFVPVIGKKAFQGKYLIKIIVKQGDPARYYCFSQKITIQNGKQIQNHEVFSCFIRTNMGCVEEIKGLNLLKEIKQRAIRPSVAKTIFHPGCNPEPLNLEETGFVISIANVSQEEFKEINSFFKEILSNMDISFDGTHDLEKKSLQVKYQNKAEFEKLKDVFKESLEYINEESKYHFKVKGEKKRQFMLKKVSKFDKDKDDQDEKKTSTSEQKLSERKEKKKTEEKVQQRNKVEEKYQEKRSDVFVKVDKKTQNKHENHKKQYHKKDRPDKNDKLEKGYLNQQQNSQKQFFKKEKKSNYNREEFNEAKMKAQISPKKNHSNFPKKYNLAFTHIQPNCGEQIVNFLKILFPSFQMEHTLYKNTVEVFFRDEESRGQCQVRLIDEEFTLKQFSFKGKGLIWGRNQNILTIRNYDKNKRYDLKSYVESLSKRDLHSATFEKFDNTFVLALLFSRPDAACRWLDILLQDHTLKQKFSIPGSQTGKRPKIKICLQLENELQNLANMEEYVTFV